MTTYITHLDVSLHEAEEEKLQSQGFMKINVDLNKGAGGKYIYIWYKKESRSAPITGLQVTFNDDMAVGLINAGYTKIDKDLNAGARGFYLYLWYFRGSGEYHTPIVEIDVTTDAKSEAHKFLQDWERLDCDLNRGAGGNWIHAWVKREKQTYICDKNRFKWIMQGYTSVSVNLNERTGGNQVYLWYKKRGCNNPIKAITLLLNTDVVQEYKKAGVTVIDRNINLGLDRHLDQHYLRSCPRSSSVIQASHCTSSCAPNGASAGPDHPLAPHHLRSLSTSPPHILSLRTPM
ncbi:uncharacterized protein LOC120546400 [Perca fluviatilis]|uniref:uncharacterized protein LOC120546400 n=1 Tax=Perca fluviatilis TaxID=8168 RepID=UPI001965C0AC|nr:uncharacterized protein LOC120546400 [Perca fluviatilis]